MANKAFGLYEWGPYVVSDKINVAFSYAIVNDTTDYVEDHSIHIPIDFADNPRAIWDRTVEAVRTEQSDPSLEVVPMPSGFDYLLSHCGY